MPAYLKIEGVPGECTATGFEDQIEVLSFGHGVSQQSRVSASGGGGATSGRCEHSDFTIGKEMDKSSPILAQKCSEGKHIPSVMLSLTKAGGDGEYVVYMVYQLTNCIISNCSVGGGGDGIPQENLSFNYGKIDWTYTQQNRKDGSGSGQTTGSWNLKADTTT